MSTAADDLANSLDQMNKYIRQLLDDQKSLQDQINALQQQSNGSQQTAFMGPINPIGLQSYVDLVEVITVNPSEGTWTGLPLRTDESGFLNPSIYGVGTIKGQVGAADITPSIGQTIGVVFTGQEATPDNTLPHHGIICQWDTYMQKLEASDNLPGFTWEKLYNQGIYDPSMHTDVYGQIVNDGSGRKMRYFTTQGGSGGGTSYSAGCGIDNSSLASHVIEVKNSDLIGAGIVASDGCGLQANIGCGLRFNTVSAGDTKIIIDPHTAMLQGNGTSNGGLAPFNSTTSDCRFGVNVGCGLELTSPGSGGFNAVKVAPDQIAGAGLQVDPANSGETECKIAVKTGCGLYLDPDDGTLNVDLTDFAGSGLGIDTSGDCPQLTATVGGGHLGVGCGLHVDGGGIVYVYAPDLVDPETSGLVTNGTCGIRINFGCGLQLVANQLRVKPADIAVSGSALVTTGTCGLKVNAGCGLTIASNVLQVSRSDLVGPGLQAVSGGSGCLIGVKPGCGITFVSGAVTVDTTALIGAGLAQGTGCSINVNPGCGIDLIGGTTNVKLNGLNGGIKCDPDLGIGLAFTFCYAIVTSDASESDTHVDVESVTRVAGGDQPVGTSFPVQKWLTGSKYTAGDKILIANLVEGPTTTWVAIPLGHDGADGNSGQFAVDLDGELSPGSAGAPTGGTGHVYGYSSTDGSPTSIGTRNVLNPLSMRIKGSASCARIFLNPDRTRDDLDLFLIQGGAPTIDCDSVPLGTYVSDVQCTSDGIQVTKSSPNVQVVTGVGGNGCSS